MKLYLLRHGEAEMSAASDAVRRLTGKGHSDVKSVARQFARLDLVIDKCLCSPYVRARETAHTFLQSLEADVVVEETAQLTPDTRANAVMDLLSSLAGSSGVLLVGHNPSMSELHALLTEGSLSQMHILGTGELVVISIDIIGLGMGTRTRKLLPGTSPQLD
ncbi:MAG TPA: phosphohistidine phosphatase SixA [Pseudomonadaceae bacterium]|nr:phosphohistidine phosphatase SixA [Pseudomonadaceae bacterium]